MTANGRARFGDDFTALQTALDRISSNPFEVEPPDSSLLEPQETTSRNISDYTYRARFMAGNEEEHAATREAYIAIYKSPSAGHVMALDTCRKYATFAREKMSGEVKVFTSACRDRWCPMCAGQKSSYAKDQTEVFLKSLKAARFLTLTLRNNESDLLEQINFLTSSFRTLRQRAYWKRHVTGGIWFLQVKRGKDSGLWHPHLHIVLDGEYMEQGRLSALWEQVTFGSPVIDIRRIHDIDYAASYVARYTARPAKMEGMPLDDRIEIIEALFRKRLCGTFGTGKTVTLSPPKIESDGEWQNLGYYDEVVCKAQSDPAAKKILIAYHNELPLTESEYTAYTGNPVWVEVKKYEPRVNKQMLLDFYNTS